MFLLEATFGNNFLRYSKSISGVEANGVLWKKGITSISGIEKKIKKKYGGYGAISLGTIGFNPETISHPPVLKINLVGKYLLPDGTIKKLFEAIAYLSEIKKTEIIYKLYPADYDVDFLILGEDLVEELFPGYEMTEEELSWVEKIPMPKVLGYATLFDAPRLPPKLDAEQNISFKYYKCGISGSSSAEYDFYDEANLYTTENDDIKDSGEYIESEVNILGNVKMTGYSSEYPDLNKLALGAAVTLGLSIDISKARDPSPLLGHVVTQQIKILDLLDQQAAFYSHFFEIREGVLHLVDMLREGESRVVSGDDYHTSNHKYPSPVKEFSSTWSVTTIVKDDTDVSNYEIDNREIILARDFERGSEKNYAAFHENLAEVENALKDIAWLEALPVTTIKMPFEEGIYYNLGDEIEWITLEHYNEGVCVMKARNFNYNINDDVITISGEVKVQR